MPDLKPLMIAINQQKDLRAYVLVRDDGGRRQAGRSEGQDDLRAAPHAASTATCSSNAAARRWASRPGSSSARC